MVCDKVVCDENGVRKMVCDQVVCERWCVTKWFVTEEGAGGGGGGGGGDADEKDTGGDLKTRTPHNFVGNGLDLQMGVAFVGDIMEDEVRGDGEPFDAL